VGAAAQHNRRSVLRTRPPGDATRAQRPQCGAARHRHGVRYPRAISAAHSAPARPRRPIVGRPPAARLGASRGGRGAERERSRGTTRANQGRTGANRRRRVALTAYRKPIGNLPSRQTAGTRRRPDETTPKATGQATTTTTNTSTITTNSKQTNHHEQNRHSSHKQSNQSPPSTTSTDLHLNFVRCGGGYRRSFSPSPVSGTTATNGQHVTHPGTPGETALEHSASNPSTQTTRSTPSGTHRDPTLHRPFW